MTSYPTIQQSNLTNTVAAEPPQSRSHPTFSPNSSNQFKKVGKLDSRKKSDVIDRLDTVEFEGHLLSSNLPPWRPIPSRMAAKMLGVSIQTLANWRMRDIGPPAEPMLKRGGNRIYYKPDRIWAWLQGPDGKPWEISARWLKQKDLTADSLNETQVLECSGQLDKLDVFPKPQRLWRQFRE